MAYDKKLFREQLSKKESVLALADFFIKKAIEEECKGKEDSAYCSYFSLALDTFVRQGIELTFKYAESEIERIFLNSLLMCFVKADPLNLILTAPYSDAPAMIKNFRDYHQNCLNFWNEYKKRSGDTEGTNIHDFLNKQIDKGHMNVKEKEDLIMHIILFHKLNYFYSFHLTIQSGFPDFKIDGKAIRSDILIWIPGNQQFNLVVECDGWTSPDLVDTKLSNI